MAPPLVTSFGRLFITLMEIKKSEIYDGRRRLFVEENEEILRKIKLNDATDQSH
jgi:hypothetical protein